MPRFGDIFGRLRQVAPNLRIVWFMRIFLDERGERPVLRHQPQLQTDPNYQDCIPFYEYFHGDTGRGIGASHQSGWTALIAKLLTPRAHE